MSCAQRGALQRVPSTQPSMHWSGDRPPRGGASPQGKSKLRTIPQGSPNFEPHNPLCRWLNLCCNDLTGTIPAVWPMGVENTTMAVGLQQNSLTGAALFDLPALPAPVAAVPPQGCCPTASLQPRPMCGTAAASGGLHGFNLAALCPVVAAPG